MADLHKKPDMSYGENSPEPDRNKKGKRTAAIFIAFGCIAAFLLGALILKLPHGEEETHQHVYSRKVLKNATCSKNGKAEYRCIGCGDTYTEKIPRIGHTVDDWGSGDGLLHQSKCSECGEDVNIMYNSKTGVKFIAPVYTRGNRTAATVINKDGFAHKYIFYLQNARYNSYSRYMRLHGCSTCALTSVLNADCPELDGYTPDRIVEETEYEVFGKKAFYKNYKKDKKNGDMPVTLYGMTKIFDAYGVKYGLPTADTDEYVNEITEHLENGDPVIITFARGGKGGLSNSIHTIDLIAIDAEGHIIIGDSLLKKSADWGDNGLIKPGKITVKEMVSYITTYGGWSVSSDTYKESGSALFFNDRRDKGYLLVFPGGNNKEENQ